jgi:ABC-type nitrate/sulfonate/bicarbonate transport system permease component
MTLRDINANFFSSAYLVAHGVAQSSYLDALLYTTKNVLVGTALGAVIGIALGVGSIRFMSVSEVVNPVMATLGAAPIFVAAPFFLIWFGIVPGAQILMVAFYTSLLMYLFARRAVENLGVHYVEYALTLGTTGRQLLWRVYLPGSVPQVAGGFRIALAGAWGLEAIAELLGAQRGIGFLINFYSGAYVIQGMLSVVVLLGLVAVAADRVAVLCTQSVTRWVETGRHVA